MARFYLYAGLAAVVCYTGLAFMGTEFGSPKIKKVTPSQAAAARAAQAARRRSSGGYYGGGGFGGGK